jgi:hypothetical protein
MRDAEFVRDSERLARGQALRHKCNVMSTHGSTRSFEEWGGEEILELLI